LYHGLRTPSTDREVDEADIRPVEDGDDQHRTQVIGDGQHSDKDLEGDGGTTAQQGQQSDSEGNVRGHGDAPYRMGFAARVEQQKDERWHDHTSKSGR
jgi:hypothetical protein